MASVSGVLPKIFRWVFTVLAGLMALGAIAICLVMVCNPHLPAGTHFGPSDVDFLGQPGSVELRATGGDSNFIVTAFRGSVTLFVGKAGSLIEVIKHYGLPFVLLRVIFLAAVFELLRRLFRNVGRGESFSQDTVRLVQILGGVLIAFSFILSFAGGLFAHAVYAYIAQNAVITISGTAVHLPSSRYAMFPRGDGFPFGSPLFFTGLLVLALSEVFRQGVALKKENELTI
jgi:hypothetical protein